MNYRIQQTESFTRWLTSLRDIRTKAAIACGIDCAANSNLGDIKPVDEGVSEMRIDVGTGYCVYFTVRGGDLLVLLAGGDHSSQQADIKRALKLSKEI